MNEWTTTEGTFKSWDKTELFYRTWKPKASSDKALVIIHRGHEHSGRVAQQVQDLNLTDFWAFSWDCRGHGNSPGDRGYAESYYDIVKDLDSFVKYLSENYNIPIENIIIVANSIGAVTASAWVHDYAPRIRAMVLAAPAFRIKLYIPFTMFWLRQLNKIKKKAFVKSYVKSKMLTHDKEQAKKYDEDELITRNIAVNILVEIYDISTRILDDASAIFIPTLILSAGSDWVVKNCAQKKFFERLSSKTKQMEVYKGFLHAILYEKDRQKPISKAREFILEAFKTQTDLSFLIKNDQKGHTKEEYDKLCQPAPFPKNLTFGFQKFITKIMGRLSKGIKLGWETGFDSGKSLDYVYENKARGIGIPGKIIDQNYLNAIGWKDIRKRYANLKDCLKETIQKIKDSGKDVHIMDIASGPGRYVIEVLKEIPNSNITVLLRDNDTKNLESGMTLAGSYSNIKFEEGDAFNTQSISETKPNPNIVIVSGLYELFPENQMILNSLKGIAKAITESGYLIYTCQPWHPLLEISARTLINRNGDPWIMRQRIQAEMDELVRSVGFEKIDTKIGPYGIFTVSLAQKIK